MGDDLSKLPFAVGLGRATRAIIVSIGIATSFHEVSALVVVANALRLLRYKEVHITA